MGQTRGPRNKPCIYVQMTSVRRPFIEKMTVFSTSDVRKTVYSSTCKRMKKVVHLYPNEN